MTRQDKKPILTASDLASWSYCPESWRLSRLQGHDPANKAQLRAGEARHERWHATFTLTRLLIWIGTACLLIAAAMLLAEAS